MNLRRYIFFILLPFLLILPVTLSFPAHQPEAAAAANPTDAASLTSQVVCSPGSHSSCQAGPYTETYTVSEPTWVVIDVFLVHTGSYETNESSHFFSPFGDILDCGPLLPGEAERHCGQVRGLVDNSLDLTIEHAGIGSETGSHKQRYELKLCDMEIYFPAILKRAP